MRYKNLNIILIFLFGIIVCYSQPNYIKGYSQFSIKHGCKTILFKLNEKDSIFYDSKNQYQLTFKYCNYYKKCYSKNNGKYLSYEGKLLRYEYHYLPNLVVEIKRIKNEAIMMIFFENIGEFKFSTEIVFKKGNYYVDVQEVFKQSKIIRRTKYSQPFIELKNYERK
jgi:hypothetical protein